MSDRIEWREGQECAAKENPAVSDRIEWWEGQEGATKEMPR